MTTRQALDAALTILGRDHVLVAAGFTREEAREGSPSGRVADPRGGDGGGPMTVTVTPGVGAMSGGSVWVAFGIVAFIVLGYALALWLGGRQ